MKWSWSFLMVVLVLIVAAFVLALASPARGESRVFGIGIGITLTTELPHARHPTTSGYWVQSDHGNFATNLSPGCGAPALGSAYMQYVKLENGTEYRTLYSGDCMYEVRP